MLNEAVYAHVNGRPCVILQWGESTARVAFEDGAVAEVAIAGDLKVVLPAHVQLVIRELAKQEENKQRAADVAKFGSTIVGVVGTVESTR